MLSIEKNTEAIGNTAGLETIKKIVADYYKMPMDVYEKKKKCREGDVMKLRQVMAYVTRTLFPKTSLKAIGKSLGGFNHATILNSVKRMKNLIETEKKLGTEVNSIIDTIMNAGTIEAADLQEKMGKDYFYVKLDNIKVLRFAKDSAIVFTGMADDVIDKIKDILHYPDMPVKEFRHTGISILEKRT